GKSNLVLAIGKFMSIIGDGKLSANINTNKFKLNPESKDLPVKFEMEFSIGDTMYLYGIECNHTTIVHEWLYDTTDPENDELLLERKTVGNRSYEIEFCQKWNETPEQKVINGVLEKNLLRDDELILHHRETLLIDDLSTIINYLNSNIFVVKKESTPLSFLQFIYSHTDIVSSSEFIARFDTGIHSVTIEEIPLESILADYSNFVEKYNLSISKEELKHIQGL
ncbi:MAG TPA: hypothetical protein PLW09_13700, partial [Candidatus Kapabacteria bacterium]|nr:hypothetical protein [Candidatus Kapabacteria bacterium]